MLSINSNRIYLTRGDTARITISVTGSGGEPYRLQEGDVMKLTVKNSTSDTEKLIQKTFDADGTVLIEYEDTAQLMFGDYVYDVQLTTADGERNTIIIPSRFTIGEEVNYD